MNIIIIIDRCNEYEYEARPPGCGCVQCKHSMTIGGCVVSHTKYIPFKYKKEQSECEIGSFVSSRCRFFFGCSMKIVEIWVNLKEYLMKSSQTEDAKEDFLILEFNYRLSSLSQFYNSYTSECSLTNSFNDLSYRKKKPLEINSTPSTDRHAT